MPGTEVETLLMIQDLDLKILRAEKQLDELPEKRAILEARSKIAEVEGLKAKAGVLVSKLESELKAHQDETEMIAEKLATEQAKVMETSDHRQVQAITREMDGLKRRRDKLDTESIQLMERIERARGQVDKIDAALGQLHDKENVLIDEFKLHGGELQTGIGKLKAHRDALGARIDPGLLERYETSRAAKGSIGVGKLEGSACSACRMELPAERVKELLAGDPVGICPQCRRLIVVITPDE